MHLLDDQPARIARADDDDFLAARDDAAVGRSITVRASSREPGDERSVIRKSIAAIERGSAERVCTGDAKKTTRSATIEAMTTPRAATHMSRTETYRHQRL